MQARANIIIENLAAYDGRLFALYRTLDILSTNLATLVTDDPGISITATLEQAVAIYTKNALGCLMTYDGIFVFNKQADRDRIDRAMQQMMADPNQSETMPFMTALGMKAVTVAQLQGVLAAGLALESAMDTAHHDCIEHHLETGFAEWAAARDHHAERFGVHHAGFSQ